MAKYRILSIDGGGIRGIIPAILLKRLTEKPEISSFLEEADLIAGTSTGGLLALGIANGMDPGEMRDVYVNDGKNIFDDSWLDDLKDLGGISGADYDIKMLDKVLQRIFGDKKLKSLKKNVLITAFDLDNEEEIAEKRRWKPKIFHNMKGKDNDGEMPAYKVGLYTSAAPTYFPTVDGYIDGGVFASNPAMCALAQTQDKRYFNPPVSLNDIYILSIGTGTSMQYIKGKNLDWGYAQWVKPLISLMMDGVNGIADYQCAQILKDNYFRLEPCFPPEITVPMDGVKKIPYMIDFAQNFDLRDADKRDAAEWIKEKWVSKVVV